MFFSVMRPRAGFSRWAGLYLIFLSCHAVWAQAPTAADSLHDLVSTGQYKEAKVLAIDQLGRATQRFGAGSTEETQARLELAKILVRLQENREAESILIQVLNNQKQASTSENLEMADTYNSLGTVNYNLANYEQSIEYYTHCMDIRARLLGTEHPDIARSLSNLGNVYNMLCQFSKAEELYRRSMEIRRKALGPMHIDMAHSMNGLGIANRGLGNYAQAEKYFLKSLEINKKIFGDKHPNVAAVLTNLGGLYHKTGETEKAEWFQLEALAIRRKLGGPASPLNTANLNALASLYESDGRFRKAEICLKKSQSIYKANFGDSHLFIANTHLGLGTLYRRCGSMDKAASELDKAEAIWKKVFGDKHILMAQLKAERGRLLRVKGQYLEAAAEFEKALATQQKLQGENHPECGRTLHDLGLTYFCAGKMKEAETHLLHSAHHALNEVKRLFPALSEREKENYYRLLETRFQEFYAFCMKRYPENPAIAGEMYNLVLATKAILLNSSAKWKHRIKVSGDRKLLQLYNAWEGNQSILSKLLDARDSTYADSIEALVAKGEKYEKELSGRSESFALLTEKEVARWNRIQAKLKPGEAAIEVVRLNTWGSATSVYDSTASPMKEYKQQGLSKRVAYAMLILKPGLASPKLTFLPNGDRLESACLERYRQCIRWKQEDQQSYSHFWAGISKALGKGVRRVYFSPDGVYHSINPASLKNPSTGKFLLEEMDIRLVTVTKDLLQTSSTESSNKLSYLFGNPDFSTGTPAKSPADTTEEMPTEGKDRPMSLPGVTLNELPGTQREIIAIDSLFSASGWEVQNFMGREALEETLKDTYKPRVLHIATHGFFSSETRQNPMFSSGLLLAGVQESLQGKSIAAEDGILTAYEAMNLNLDNTDLVVLSACETGLGEIKNGEGVYGLQRAFKVAGAKTLIMSLWKVSDQATQELMVSFYKHWLASSSKRTAFLAAQKQLKAKYPEPYFWGAFVMMGE